MTDMVKTALFATAALIASLSPGAVPHPEHPRPDMERGEWLSLNGEWDFEFERHPEGTSLPKRPERYGRKITVPFGWGSPLSGVEDGGDFAWYRREVEIPADWKSPRTFLVVGASDWQTDVFIDGKFAGRHQGGYMPFEVELTPFVAKGSRAVVELRVWDEPASGASSGWRLFGKQGYGNVRGVWQTVYLEGRGENWIESLKFSPSLKKRSVEARIRLDSPAKKALSFSLEFKPEDRDEPARAEFAPGETEKTLVIPLENVKEWSLESPYLYETTARAGDDCVRTYFGMREIGTGKNPNGHAYVTLNGKPVYLRLALDQGYFPGGFYTYPSDEDVKKDIELAKSLGLNGLRFHIKAESPRKLYWADRLGLLVMADVPNWWGPPCESAFREHRACFEAMVERDYNHPSVFAWVLFNETWGLFTGGKYRDATKARVAEAWRRAKATDPTRLVEDNSPCNGDHTVTDINTWHCYLSGWKWEETLERICDDTYVGSGWNCADGFEQTEAPMFNSECGNVWGYAGSTGDCDITWDYHMMMNAFRRRMKCAGWLYTEHHDVTNEWNGYVRADRSAKEFGIKELFPGMDMRDLHADAYIPLDVELCREFDAGETYCVPVDISLATDALAGKELKLRHSLRFIDAEGRLLDTAPVTAEGFAAVASPWQEGRLAEIPVKLPDFDACGTVNFELLADGETVARNFTCFVTRKEEPEDARPARAEWSLGSREVMSGMKQCGAGTGFFEYEFDAPEGACVFRAEVSAKRTDAKDIRAANLPDSDISYMLGGVADRSQNPNSCPQTCPSAAHRGKVSVYANGTLVAAVELPDDPADHRGILSWFAQKRPQRPGFFRSLVSFGRAREEAPVLRDAGSYGYLVEAEIPAEVVAESKDGKLAVRLEAEGTGLSVYGPHFGRMPFGPHISPLAR
ncbi:MAG: glycoside hydrolase family 2 [Kiritimatiellae bacterium]|nr:glycoside hydrolase family 2 [Kiritimatiellia bacterium]